MPHDVAIAQYQSVHVLELLAGTEGLRRLLVELADGGIDLRALQAGTLQNVVGHLVQRGHDRFAALALGQVEGQRQGRKQRQ